MPAAPRITIDRTALLVLDLQEKLMPVIEDGERVLERAAKLIRGCAALGVPMLATEQYPRGLGPTVEPIRAALPEAAPRVEKVRFSGCVEETRRQLDRWRRPVVLVCGVEAHVCVLQTALDLLEVGYTPAVVGDAVSSRRAQDEVLAMQRMTAAGVVPASVEMALMEMTHEAGTERFKAILPLIR